MKKNLKKSIGSVNAGILDLTILDSIEKLVFDEGWSLYITSLQNHLYHYSHFHHFFLLH